MRIKRIVSTALMTALITGAGITAHAYNNSAYMGKWISVKADEQNYSQLFVNYSDENEIYLTLKQTADGKEPFVYKVYSGKIEDNAAKLAFEYTDEYGTKGTGRIEMAMYIDNIWLSAYSDDNRTLMQGMFKYAAGDFNAYASPYSYNVNIALNGEKQEFAKKPFIVQGTTYVPLRGLFDKMNLNVYWDDYKTETGKTQLITATQNSTIMQFERGETEKGFKPWTLTKWESDYPDTADTAVETKDIREIQPIIIDGASYVPLRMVSESFGAQVGWNDELKTVEISASTASDTKKLYEDEMAVQSYTKKQADETAKDYTGMKMNDERPYYTYKSKYFVYEQDGKRYKLNYNGEIGEIAETAEAAETE